MAILQLFARGVRRLLYRQILGLTALLVAGGCADLTAIKQFSQISADGAGYTAISNDYVEAPSRERRYLLAGNPALAADVDARAAARKAEQPRLEAIHAVIEQYMKALGALAADDVVVYDKQVSALVTNATSAGLIPKEDAEPLAALISVVAQAATEFYRQRKLKEVILQADPPLQRTLDSLRLIVGRGMLQSLEDEKAMFDFHYQYLKAAAAKNEPVARQLVIEAMEDGQGKFEPRRKAINSYLIIIDSISKGHANLAANVDHLSAAEVIATTKSYAEKIYGALKALQSAKA